MITIEKVIDFGFKNAIVEGDFDKVKQYVCLGADINFNDGLALLIAVHKGNLDIVQFLIERGGDLDALKYALPYAKVLQKERITNFYNYRKGLYYDED